MNAAPPWLRDLEGRAFAFIRVDQQTRLQFDEFEVVIESPFTLRVPPDSERLLDPSDRGSLGPLLELYPQRLLSVSVEAGALHIEFEGGALVVVPPDDRYEAWQVNGPGNLLAVCAPGGDLSIWS